MISNNFRSIKSEYENGGNVSGCGRHAKTVVDHRYVSMVGRGRHARTVVEQAYVSMVGRGRSARTVVDHRYVSMVGIGRGARNAVNLQIILIGSKYEFLSLLGYYSTTSTTVLRIES